VSFGFALERANSVCVTNCCRNTVPYDWPGHREGSVAKLYIYTVLGKNDLQFSLNNFNKSKRNFALFGTHYPKCIMYIQLHVLINQSGINPGFRDFQSGLSNKSYKLLLGAL